MQVFDSVSFTTTVSSVLTCSIIRDVLCKIRFATLPSREYLSTITGIACVSVHVGVCKVLLELAGLLGAEGASTVVFVAGALDGRTAGSRR